MQGQPQGSDTISSRHAPFRQFGRQNVVIIQEPSTIGFQSSAIVSSGQYAASVNGACADAICRESYHLLKLVIHRNRDIFLHLSDLSCAQALFGAPFNLYAKTWAVTVQTALESIWVKPIIDQLLKSGMGEFALGHIEQDRKM